LLAQRIWKVTQAPPENSAARLLVVDDEAVPRLIVARAAETLGIVTDAAATLAEAVKRVRAVVYDVVVLDLGLRDHDGVELLRSLHEVSSEAALVFVSGFDERVRQAAARLAGALGLRVAGTLGKPLRVEPLVTLLRTLPERAHAKGNEDVAEIDPSLLAAGINADEIVCLFQPKVTLRARRLIGVEALTRWHSPVLGLVGPDRFIPVAERAGLIDQLTYRMLAQALASFRPWQAEQPDMTIAVNLSPVTLADLSLPERICTTLAQASVPPSALVLEVTEGAVMENFVTAADVLTRLRIRGVKLSIDDFGTGNSSLLSLLRLPFSELKIDQRFVRSCLHDPEAPKIIRAIVSLARELGLQLVAEGIEAEPVADLLERLGCPVGQGYLFARPLGQAGLVERLRAAAWAEGFL
jgi:EAL domain-containing protein (putative c-di-GMP-specific phosphodiesterase class I)/ActR/RegA family two-component response regulator